MNSVFLNSRPQLHLLDPRKIPDYLCRKKKKPLTCDQKSLNWRCRKTPPEQRINGMNKIKQPPIPLPCRLCGVTSHSVIVQHGEGIGGSLITHMTEEGRKERKRASNRKWHAANREKAAEKNGKWREANAEKLAEKSRKRRAANTEKMKERDRKYREANRELVRSNARMADRRRHAKWKSDPIYQMARRVRGRMHTALREKGFSKESKTQKMLGCTFKQFAKHIESQFTDGMSWDNRSEWHLDHIVPLSCATTIEGLEKLSHYKNIRPLWAADNLIKSNKLVLV